MQITSFRVVHLMALVGASLLCDGLAFSRFSIHQAQSSIATRRSNFARSSPQQRPSAEVAAQASAVVLVPTRGTSTLTRITDNVRLAVSASFSPFIRRVRNLLFPEEWKGLSTKEILSKVGISAFVSFGIVKQLINAITFPLAWYIHTSQTGLSPFAPGQWKLFLAIYAGFRAVDAVTIPLQLAVGVGASPLFRRIIDLCKSKLRMKTGVATFLVALVSNLVAVGALAGNVVLVSIHTGVPVF